MNRKRNRGCVVPVMVICWCLTGWVARAAQPVLEFTGNDSYIDLGTPEALHMSENAPFTIEGWMKLKRTSGTDMLYSRRASRDSGSYTYMFGTGDGNKMRAYIGHGASPVNTTWRDVTLDPVLETDRWYHLAFSFDGEDLVYYLDGVAVGTNDFAYADHAGYQVMIGGYHAGSDVDGFKSDVRVWDHARGQAQIQTVMTNRLTGSETGLLGYWPMNEGKGEWVGDATTNQNVGAIINAEWTVADDLDFWHISGEFLYALPFTLADQETGSTEFTNSNEVDIVDFPVPDGYDQFQITESGETNALGAWASTSAVPAVIEFTQPSADTNITLYAWFTNDTDNVVLRRSEGAIFYTDVAPVPAVHATVTIERLAGQHVVIYPEHVNAGSTGGVANEREMEIFARKLLCEEDPSCDLTPDDPFVTVDDYGDYSIVLWLQNEAGNTAVSATTSTVSVIAYSGTNVWTGAGETDLWHDPANWSAGVPQAGQDVRIDAGPDARLTAATAKMRSFFLDAGRTLTVEGWDSALEATELTIAGTMTHLAQTATEPDPGTGEWVPDHRILLNGQNITLTATGILNANARGYLGGYGPGAGVTSRGGGGYGGAGGSGHDGHYRGEAYGEADEPWQPGSGGGTSGEGVGGAGGGAIRIQATGAVSVDGKIMVNGQNGSGTSRPGGSGGGVWITCHTFHGAETGEILAHGGNGTVNAADAGGGRIAIHYDPAAQAALAKPVPDVMFSIRPGNRTIWLYAQEMGTLYLPDTLFLSVPLDAQRFWHTHLVLGDLTQWTIPELLLDHCIVRVPEGFDLEIEDDLILRNGARLGLHAAPTNAFGGAFGARLDVGGAIQLENDSWLDVFAHWTNAAVVGLYVAGDVTIDVDSGIDAAGRGYRHFHGPGRGQSGYAAGSYGGLGGRSPGPTYGSTVFAVDPGSPGGTRIRTGPVSGLGGGAIRLMVGGDLHVDGLLTANGMNGTYHGGGGGSGGSIFVACQRMTGTGTLRANGGMDNNNGGKGGGGRIAVWYRMPLSRVEQHLAARNESGFTVHEQQPSSFEGTLEANSPQTGDYPGEHGTIRFCTLTGTLLMMR